MILTKDKSFYKSLVLLALPIAIQNLLTFLVGFMDNVMIGQLGDAPISGVYIGGQIQTLLQVFSGGIEGAMLILSAQYFGAGDKESIKKITSIGLRFTVTFSALITLICTVFPSFVISLFTKEEKIIEAGSQYLEILAISFIFFCITQA
jgi:Na+-driven multidrug efflux pump